MKLWLIVIEGVLAALAIFAGIWAFQIWQDSNSPKAGGCQETIVVGKSVNGVEITACRLIGSAIDSKNALLVIGTIHGDEPDGKRVIDKLLTQAVSKESEIWVIRDGNPDGAVLVTRRNANGVDINRNFPIKWEPSDPTARTYSGPSPASEPETLALMQAVQKIQPTRIVVFHQPYAQIDCPPERPATISDRLSQITGYKSECIPGEKSGSPTNTYTGTFTIWVNSTFPDTTAVTFELGLTTLDAKIQTIAKAMRTLAAETAYLP
jgi:hypothetical protein